MKDNFDAQVSKGLMSVFMKATQAEQAMMDLILTAAETCNSALSEEKQLSDLFAVLGMEYDATKADDGGVLCFSGPEGMLSLSCVLCDASLLQVSAMRLLQLSCNLQSKRAPENAYVKVCGP